MLQGSGISSRDQAFHLYVREGEERPAPAEGIAERKQAPNVSGIVLQPVVPPAPPRSPQVLPAAFPSWDIRPRDVSLGISLGKQGLSSARWPRKLCRQHAATRGPRGDQATAVLWLAPELVSEMWVSKLGGRQPHIRGAC